MRAFNDTAIHNCSFEQIIRKKVNSIYRSVNRYWKKKYDILLNDYNTIKYKLDNVEILEKSENNTIETNFQSVDIISEPQSLVHHPSLESSSEFQPSDFPDKESDNVSEPTEFLPESQKLKKKRKKRKSPNINTPTAEEPTVVIPKKINEQLESVEEKPVIEKPVIELPTVTNELLDSTKTEIKVKPTYAEIARIIPESTVSYLENGKWEKLFKMRKK